MLNFMTLARKALLAAALVLCSGAALAGPNYLVTVHTQGYSGESGLLDFGFESYSDAPGAIAHLWNLSGAFGEEYDRTGSVDGDLASGFTFSNSNLSNYLTYGVILGGDFSFNISFHGDYETMEAPNGATFIAALYATELSELLGALVQFDLIPAFNGNAAGVLVSANQDLADVADIPEPSQLLLMLSALALAGVAHRRARNKG
jgi:hypothetical protein